MKDKVMEIPKYVGSKVVIAIGCLLLAASIEQMPKATNELARLSAFDSSLSGIVMILGACAYSSAKRRRLGEAQGKGLRIFLELFAVLVIGFLTFGRNDLKMAIIEDPVSSFVIPVCCILAYAFQFVRALASTGSSQPASSVEMAKSDRQG
jgi:hypothetical protein